MCVLYKLIDKSNSLFSTIMRMEPIIFVMVYVKNQILTGLYILYDILRISGNICDDKIGWHKISTFLRVSGEKC